MLKHDIINIQNSNSKVKRKESLIYCILRWIALHSVVEIDEVCWTISGTRYNPIENLIWWGCTDVCDEK